MSYVPPHLRNGGGGASGASKEPRAMMTRQGADGSADPGSAMKDDRLGGRGGRAGRGTMDFSTGPGTSGYQKPGEEKEEVQQSTGPKFNNQSAPSSPVDTVAAWRERGKNAPKDVDLEKEIIAIFGEPKKEGEGGGSGINFDSFFDIPVSLTGEGFEEIKEIESFQLAGPSIHPLLLENIGRIGYNKPTPVQKWSIPVLFAGRDLMACAQTGSGKTAAFLFPIISKMLNDGPPQANGRYSTSRLCQKPNAMVLSPTRELATQIYDEAKKFAFNTGIRPVVVYGGQNMRDQVTDMRSGCDIIIATPGRLVDHCHRKQVDLSDCYYFVLDEADRMLDMGFAPQIANIVDITNLPNKQKRQTIMFSATFPEQIQVLAEEFMDDYLYLTVGRVGSTNECITQVVQYADESQKPARLIALLNEVRGLTLVFVETKKKADLIHDFLCMHDIGAASIHGDRTQQEREEALDLFKNGKVSVMVATDVVGRGLDIPNVTHVVNHDMPKSIDDYVHRIGRTGRAGNKGRATTFIDEKNGAVLRELVTVLTEAKQDTPQWLVDMVSQGSSFAKGGAAGAGRRFGKSDGMSAYGGTGGGGGRGMATDHRYAGGNIGPQQTGYRVSKKKQVDEDLDGW